jgi:hypothetical protein
MTDSPPLLRRKEIIQSVLAMNLFEEYDRFEWKYDKFNGKIDGLSR